MTGLSRTKLLAVTALVLISAGPVVVRGQIRPFPAAPSPNSQIADAAAKEAAVRKVLRADASPTVLRAVRTVIGDYEGVARRHPASGVGDDALWRAAKLSRDAFESFRDPLERTNALRLYQELASTYPASTFARQSDDDVAWLRSTAPVATRALPPAVVRASRPSTPEAAVPAVVRAALVTSEPAAAEPATAPTPGTLVNVKAVRRTVLADVVRVVIELDGEVLYHDQRLDAPTRVFVDLESTKANMSLIDQTIRFDNDTDIVRLIRIGRHPNNTTRIVLEGSGIASYSVYPAYSPYRLVIDCIRSTPGAPAASAPLANTTARRSPTAAERPSTPSAPPAVVPAVLPSPIATDNTATETHSSTSSTPGERPSWATTLKKTPTPAQPNVPALRSKSVRWKVPLPSGTPTVLFASAGSPVPAAPVVASTSGLSINPAIEPPLPPPSVPANNVAGGLSMARQLGLGVSRIVIDAGHGGHDPGAQSLGVTESELVLDVALRLERLLSKMPGVDVVMTRRDNEFIPLQERTNIANRENADLFLSIHANASTIPAARGVETYFLNFTSNLNAAAVAARENSTSGQSMGALPDVVKNITLSSKRDESRDFATYVQREMMTSLRTQNKTLKDLGVKQAPFIVLIGASMPSILAEISFITNPQDARLLKSGAYRQRIAQALFDGVRKYQTSLKSVPAMAQQD